MHTTLSSFILKHLFSNTPILSKLDPLVGNHGSNMRTIYCILLNLEHHDKYFLTSNVNYIKFLSQ